MKEKRQMPGQSQMYLNVFKLERKFQDYLQGKPGSSAKLKQLKMGLLRALETGVTDPKLKRIASRIHGGKTLLKRILKQIGRSYAVPKAIYDHVACGTGIKKACTRWGCTPSDINAAEKLAINVGRELGSFAQGIDPAEKDWVADVEGAHEELIVHVSDRALEDMLLAGIEGYQVPKNQSTPFAEVYGICLGMVRDQRVERKGKGKYLKRHIHVVRAAVQIRARGTKNAVWPNRKSLAAQLVTAESLFLI